MPLQTIFKDKVTDTGTTQLYPLGTVRVEGNKTYEYVKATAAIAQYDGVIPSGVGTVTDAAASGNVCRGVAVAAIANASYGWIQTHGPLSPGTLAGSAAAAVYATATTGVLTTTSTGNSAALGYLEAADNIYITSM